MKSESVKHIPGQTCATTLFFNGYNSIYLIFFILEYSWYNNVVLVSGVQQSKSVIHIQVSTLF